MSDASTGGHAVDAEMPFTAHLGELRSRLVKSVIAVGAAFLGCFGFADHLFTLMAAPLRAIEVPGLTLIGTGVAEAFFTKMWLALGAAVIVALPVLLWQGWQFVAPGLYEHEKKYTKSFVFFGSLFFLCGVAFCYFIVIQQGLHFLLHRYQVIDVTPMLQIGPYLSFATRMVLAFGTMFQLPVAAFFLARVGLADHRFLISNSRYAIIVIALFAAVLTPPDLISQVLLMVPLALLYALCILIAYLARWRMNRLDNQEP